MLAEADEETRGRGRKAVYKAAWGGREQHHSFMHQ